MKSVAALAFDQVPDYKGIKRTLRAGMSGSGIARLACEDEDEEVTMKIEMNSVVTRNVNEGEAEKENADPQKSLPMPGNTFTFRS